MTEQPQILIAGAGPSGLMLACQLARWNVSFRIVDRKSGPIHETRALGVQARSLETARSLGLNDSFVESGVKLFQASAFASEKQVSQWSFQQMGKSISPYPFILGLPQEETETKLATHLEQQGYKIEWNTELISLTEQGDGVQATLRHHDGQEETADFRWLVGADGAGSRVRKEGGISFKGGSYTAPFFIVDADVAFPAEHAMFKIFLGQRSITVWIPIPSPDRYRIIGMVPKDEDPDTFDFAKGQEVIRQVVKRPITLENPKGFTVYRIHHLVAEQFRKGPLLLVGDAGHVHSPAGAQGMNTGLQDAQNLAWKLAWVVQGKASETLLDTYHAERHPFAQKLIATTDQAFQMISSQSWWAGFWRRFIAPYVIRLLTSFGFIRHRMFRLISQLHVGYPNGPLSVQQARCSGLKAGMYLPWFELQPLTGEPIVSLDLVRFPGFHLLAFTESGQRQEELEQWASTLSVPVKVVCGQPQQKKQQRAWRNKAVLVRPDGHLGWVGALPSCETHIQQSLQRWLG